MRLRGAQAGIRQRLGIHGGEHRVCHREVLWLRDPTENRRVAVDPRRVPDGPLTIDLGRGIVIWLKPGDPEPEEGRYMPHDRTCAYANPVRRDRDLAPEVPVEAAGEPLCGQPIADLFTMVQQPCSRPLGHPTSQGCRP